MRKHLALGNTSKLFGASSGLSFICPATCTDQVVYALFPHLLRKHSRIKVHMLVICDILNLL